MSRLTKTWRSSLLYRRLAAWRLPHFLIIGAQKSGTSALASYLAQHPRLALASEKEVDFFASDFRFGQGFAWYGSQWSRQLPGRTLRFEASPNYMFLPKSAERIHRHLPDAKLIAVLRDPVLRAYSAWQMYRSQLAADPEFYRNYYDSRFTPAEVAEYIPRTAAELEDFSLAIEREANLLERGKRMQLSVLELGLYARQLQRYFELFPQTQLLVLDSNDLRTRRIATLNRVLLFLGLPPENWSGMNLGDVFVGQWSAPMPKRARDFLCEYFAAPNRQLAAMLDNPPLFVRENVPHKASA
jgi:hypothetical protein